MNLHPPEAVRDVKTIWSGPTNEAACRRPASRRAVEFFSLLAMRKVMRAED